MADDTESSLASTFISDGRALNDKPAISVIMPVFECERYLAEAIDSILAQTFEDFEFLIFDDGSTDRSVEIVRQYARRDRRIRFWAKEHRGYVVWLNEGLALSTGTFVARMDADDVSMPPRFETQMKYLNDHPDCVAVGGKVMYIDPEGDPLGPRDLKLDHEGIESELLHGHGLAIVHPSVMFRTASVREVGGYRDQYERTEDLDLYLRLAEHGRLANCPQILLNYRRQPASVTGVGDHDGAMKRREDIVRETLRRRGIDTATVKVHAYPRPASLSEWHGQCATLALRNGHFHSARKHCCRSFVRNPFDRRTWRVGLHLWLGTSIGHCIDVVYNKAKRLIKARRRG